MTTNLTFEDRYLSGAELYGDDFDEDEVAQWFADEEHGYAGLGGTDRDKHDYGYAALNEHHGWSLLPNSKRFRHLLGFGSNYGDELLPMLNHVDQITLLDSSDRYVVKELQGIAVSYVLARSSGEIPITDGDVDLISCLGVLHHVPNVSRVIGEFERILAPGGTLLLREPIHSMGDWRRPRTGLTQRERGIPPNILLAILRKAGFAIESEHYCMFPAWSRVCGKLGLATFKSAQLTAVDAALSSAFSWNSNYLRTTFFQKLAPASLFIIATKQNADGSRP